MIRYNWEEDRREKKEKNTKNGVSERIKKKIKVNRYNEIKELDMNRKTCKEEAT